MKRILILAAVLMGAAHARAAWDTAGGSWATMPSIQQVPGDVVSTGHWYNTGTGNDRFVSTITLDSASTGEVAGWRWDTTFAGTNNPTALVTGLFGTLHYNASGTVTSAHGVDIFGRIIMGPLVQGFGAGVEGNCWTNTTLTTFAACVGAIGHAMDTNGTTSPLAPTIGVEGRAEAVTGTDGQTPRTGYFGNERMAGRWETYGGSTATWNSTNYNYNGAVGGSNPGKLINNGPMMSIAPAAQTLTAGQQILSDGCLTVKRINAASAITVDATHPFMPVSISTDGTANTGCLQAVVNNGAFSITIPNTADFFAYGAQSQVMQTGDGMWVASDGAEWVQIGPMQKQSGLQTMKGVVLSGGTGAATYNASGILDELIVSSGMAASSTAEQTLYIFSLPANTFVSTTSTSVSFPTRQSILIDVAGTFAAATLEEVKIKFGATTCLDSGAVSGNNLNWTASCRVNQTGTGATQAASGSFVSGTALLAVGNTAPTETISGAITIVVTGTDSVATLNGVKVTSVVVKKE